VFRPVTAGDYAVITAWYKAHRIAVPPQELLPPVGYIVEGVAAGFLYRTDGGIGILENFITNPQTRYDDRNIALSDITSELILEAEKAGLKMLYAISCIPAVSSRALQHGFEQSNRPWDFLARKV
jgi:hypothetical protein